MKNWMRNTLIALPFVVGSLSAKGQSSDDFENYLDSAKWKTYEVNEGMKQPEYCSKDSVENKTISFKEVKEKLGVDYITDIKNLGHGYITSKDKGSLEGRSENYERLKKIQNLKDGNFYGPFESTLDEVDVNDDYIITFKEIDSALEKEKQNAFLDYASKTLNTSKDSLVVVNKNIVTSKNLEGKLNILGEIYEKRFGESREELYNLVSGKDAVITKDEIYKTAEVLKKFL